MNPHRYGILILDTNYDLSNILTNLNRISWDIYHCDTPEKSLELLNNKDISVIIVNHKHPSTDGLEFLRTVKSLNSKIKRILSSDELSLDVVINSINSGVVNSIISKPIVAEKVVSEIEYLIDEYREETMKSIESSNLQKKLDFLEHHDKTHDTLLDLILDTSEQKQISDFTKQYIKAIEGIQAFCILNANLYFEKNENKHYDEIHRYLSDIEVFANQYEQKILMMYIHIVRAYLHLYNQYFSLAIDFYKASLGIMQWLSTEYIDPNFLKLIKEFPLFEDYYLYQEDGTLLNDKLNFRDIKLRIAELLHYDLGNLITFSKRFSNILDDKASAVEYLIIVKRDLPIYEHNGLGKKYSPGLISGFVVALSMFLQEVIEGSGDIDKINHHSGVILFHTYNNIKYVMLASSDDALNRIGLRQFAYETHNTVKDIEESRYTSDKQRSEIDKIKKRIFKL